jgi:hypothetical protein
MIFQIRIQKAHHLKASKLLRMHFFGTLLPEGYHTRLKVLPSDKKRSRYIVSCSSSPADPNHLIRLKYFRRRQDNGRSTAQLPSGYTFELAASKLGQTPRGLASKTGTVGII